MNKPTNFENELTECWRQFARPPDQQSHCLAAILDDVDGVRVSHALRLVAINLQDLVTHLLQRSYTLYIKHNTKNCCTGEDRTNHQ